MRHRRWSRLLLGLGAILASCTPHRAEELTQSPHRQAEPPPIRRAVVLRNLGLAIQIDSETGTVQRWSESNLRMGDVVEYLEQERELTYRNQKIPAVMVRRVSGEEGWTNRNYLVPDALPGVVIEPRSALYLQPELSHPDQVSVSLGDFVAVHPEAVPNNFVKVTYSPLRGWAVLTRYLRANTVSTVADEVTAAVLISLARSTANEVQREELLHRAAELNAPLLSSLLERELRLHRLSFRQSALTGDAAKFVVTRDGEVLPFPYVDPATAEVFDMPPVLRAGQTVTVIRKLDNGLSVWYELAEPSGFVPADQLARP